MCWGVERCGKKIEECVGRDVRRGVGGDVEDVVECGKVCSGVGKCGGRCVGVVK